VEMYQKNVSIVVLDMVAEIFYGSGFYVGENSNSLFCRL
jgi:predicted nucleic acid-binding Zn ribbon protein